MQPPANGEHGTDMRIATEPLSPHERSLLAEGIRLNNLGAYFAAHEVIEEAWCPCKTTNRRFLQAVIHIAVGNHHATNGNRLGMQRQFRKAVVKLLDYPPSHEGILVGDLKVQLLLAIEFGDLPEREDRSRGIQIGIADCQ